MDSVMKALAQLKETAVELRKTAEAIGGDYVLIGFGLWLLYKWMKEHTPIFLKAYQQERNRHRLHERKMAEFDRSLDKRTDRGKGGKP